MQGKPEAGMRLTKGCLLAGLAVVLMGAAEARAVTLPGSCGSDEAQFKVKVGKKGALPAVDAGKAQVVFIESLEGAFAGTPVVRVAVDGAWVGAVHGKSYTVFSVDPGAHTVCASRQSSTRAEKDNFGFAKVNLEAGKTYYFNFKVARTEIGSANRADGGGVAGPVPGTPNMTMRDLPTTDVATLEMVASGEGADKVKDIPAATGTPK